MFTDFPVFTMVYFVMTSTLFLIIAQTGQMDSSDKASALSTAYLVISSDFNAKGNLKLFK